MAMDPLVAAAARGSREAQEKLIRELSPEVTRYIDRNIGSKIRRHISVSDLTQEVFARVFRTLHSLPEDCTVDVLKGRLFTNARWVIASHSRTARRFVGESILSEAPSRIHDPGSDGDKTGEVTRADQVEWLLAMTEKLDPKYGKVIQMRLAGFEFSEIAERLEAKEETVRKRFQRAQVVFQRLLTEKAQIDNR